MKDNKAVIYVGRVCPAERGFLALDKQTGKEAANCWAEPNLHNNAFTLIELLVVVLIIGILAAVALPQYQKAVMKSRAVEAIVQLNALEKSQQAYFLATGGYAENLEDLDIEATVPIDVYKDQMGRINVPEGLRFEWVWAGEHRCIAYSPRANEVCKSLGGETFGHPMDNDTRTYYRIP